MGNFHKNIQLMLEFLKVSFLAVNFSTLYFDLPDDVICNIATSETLRTRARSGLLILMLEKLN